MNKNNPTKTIEYDAFLTLFKDFIEDMSKGKKLKKNGQRIKTQSAENYEYTLKLIVEFSNVRKFRIRLYLVEKLNKKEMNVAKNYWIKFYHAFCDFLYKDKGHFDNYVGRTLSNLRSFLNYMKDSRFLNVGEFHKSFYIPHEEIQIVVLSPVQLNSLIYWDENVHTLNDLERTVKDVFVFGCTVALRYSDLMALRPTHLIQIEGQFYLKLNSMKTGQISVIKLPDYAMKILGRYSKNGPFLLPQISKAYFNTRLKKLGQLVIDDSELIKYRMRRGKAVAIYKNPKLKIHYRLSDHLSSHTMRRTAITTMLRLGMSEQMVRKISGHSPASSEFYKYIAYSQMVMDEETDHMFKRLLSLK
jgi:integrase